MTSVNLKQVPPLQSGVDTVKYLNSSARFSRQVNDIQRLGRRGKRGFFVNYVPEAQDSDFFLFIYRFLSSHSYNVFL